MIKPLTLGLFLAIIPFRFLDSNTHKSDLEISHFSLTESKYINTNFDRLTAISEVESAPVPEFTLEKPMLIPTRSFPSLKSAKTFEPTFFSNKSFDNSYLNYRPSIQGKTYSQKIENIETHRINLAKFLVAAKSTDERLAILKDAGQLFSDALVNHIMPSWYGTPWDFYGHTDKPNQGKIACGYLVSTTLNHMGVNVNRYQLAQQWPIYILNSLVSSAAIDKFGTNADAIEAIKRMGHGIYLVGLDRHVGYIKYDHWGIHFLHSNYAGNKQVIAEQPDFSIAFSQSRNFYIGRLSNNLEFISQWLQKTNFTVVKG